MFTKGLIQSSVLTDGQVDVSHPDVNVPSFLSVGMESLLYYIMRQGLTVEDMFDSLN